MTTMAVIPVKRFGAAKRRLGEMPEAAAREALVAAMLEDVLTAAGACARLDRVLVVTGDERAETAARAHGASVLADPADAGHPEAALIGVRAALEGGARRAALLPGDCPLLDPAELDDLLDAAPDPGAVVVPDRHGTGTNALVLSPPDAIRPAFGPGSRERHLRLAARAGMPGVAQHVQSLALDVDTPEDLDELRRVLAADRLRAPATAAALAAVTAGTPLGR